MFEFYDTEVYSGEQRLTLPYRNNVIRKLAKII